MTVNFVSRSVSSGYFLDRSRNRRGILFPTLACYLAGNVPETWKNKLTFFFTVYHFLNQTLETAGELSTELSAARNAMLSWKVGMEIPDTFLPAGHLHAGFGRTALHRQIREYMVRLL